MDYQCLILGGPRNLDGCEKGYVASQICLVHIHSWMFDQDVKHLAQVKGQAWHSRLSQSTDIQMGSYDSHGQQLDVNLEKHRENVWMGI